MATGNKHKKLMKFGHVVSSYARGQTDILITILRTPPWGKVKTHIVVIK